VGWALKLGAPGFINLLYEGLTLVLFAYTQCSHEREALLFGTGILCASPFYFFIVPVSHLCQYQTDPVGRFICLYFRNPVMIFLWPNLR